MTKVLLLNGSPHASGCTATALEEMIKVFKEEGFETELVQVGNKNIRGCIACGKCRELGHCVFEDLVNEVAAKFKDADAHFPRIDMRSWTITEQEEHPADDRNPYPITFMTLRRKRSMHK